MSYIFWSGLLYGSINSLSASILLYLQHNIITFKLIAITILLKFTGSTFKSISSPFKAANKIREQTVNNTSLIVIYKPIHYYKHMTRSPLLHVFQTAHFPIQDGMSRREHDGEPRIVTVMLEDTETVVRWDGERLDEVWGRSLGGEVAVLAAEVGDFEECAESAVSI
ncbi:hypothetical protein EX30DRAFT_366348 [Ascodesmis nigricans]|uniref:Uncharacterized protein n=1 Tax=Ascodesmis nigricans TaxID=341454 RepID=A0A4S2MRQ0_9PEZI|nr:hypothetical protein EX30DRAFT_366348 [Ascodesmis nigricans]